MDINILLGRAKTGKSKYIFDSIIKDIESKKQPVLFVPSQMRLVTEINYINMLEKSGILGVNITTIDAFISEKLKLNNIHFDDNYISKLDRKIILTQVIEENREIFNIFSKVQKKPGFLDMLDIYMDLFKKENINVESIKKLDIKDKILELKLKEITLIYEKYIEKINNNYIDNIDKIQMYINILLNNTQILKNTTIYFDGYNNYNKSELEFIDALLKCKIDITVALDTDITKIEDIYSNNSMDIFDISNKTYLKILRLADKNGYNVGNKIFSTNYLNSNKTIKYLSQNIYNFDLKPVDNADSSLNINVFSTVYDEIEFIAKIIAKETKKKSRYKDFAIYTTNIESYGNIIQKIFYEYKIPVYFNIPQKIEDSKLTSYISYLLDTLSNNLNYKNILNLLKVGLTDISETEIFKLENYILEFNIEKYNLHSILKYNNSDKLYDIEILNNLRIRILEIYEPIYMKFKNNISAKDIINEIYSHLNKYNIFENFKKIVSEDVNNIDIFSVNNISKQAQVWEKICGIFDSICKFYIEDINIKDFNNIFKLAIRDSNLKSIPQTLDQVELLDIDGSKTTTKKIIFLIGVNENSFPKSVNQDVFFSDFELEKLSGKDIVFKESSISKVKMSLFNIYQTVNNVTQKIYFTIPSTDFLGKSLRKSNFINIIQKLIKVNVVGSINKENNLILDDIYSKEKAFDYFAISIKENNIDNNTKHLYNYFKNDKKYNRLLNYNKEDNRLNKDTINRLYGNEIKTSVSRLELFKKCPFAYYMKYCLNIKNRNEYKIASIDLGSFMHNVLERFSKHLLLNKVSWQEIIDINEKLCNEYELVLFKIIENELDENLSKHKENIKFSILKRKLTNTMVKVIMIIAKGFNQSDFIPYGYEIEFRDKGMFLPIEIDLGDNKTIKIVGKIDRVDILETEDYIYTRVIDYKSSAKDLKLEDIKEGISLQLITYITAFIKNMNKKQNKIFKPAAMLYFNLSDNIIKLSEYESNEKQIENKLMEKLRMRGIFLKDIKILEKMDKKLSEQARVIDISSRSLNSNSKKTLEDNEFNNLCLEAENILKSIVTEIISGTVKIHPNKKANHCKYCEYSCICRKDSCL